MSYLEFHRTVQGLTQLELANKARISQSYYCDVEGGRAQPSGKIIGRIARAIGRPKEEVIGKLFGVDPKDMVCASIGA